jgi:molybdopterin molybdotransferase
MLVALLRRLGCDVRDLGVAVDDPAELRTAIEEGLRADALFVSGGMSMGEYDYVPRILREMNFDFHVTKLKIKPGKPFVFATRQGLAGVGRDAETGRTFLDTRRQFVFGLPGNPVSGFVCTVRLAARLLSRLAGEPPRERWTDATLIDPLRANGPREFYQPAILTGSAVRPLHWKGSADIYTLARANALLVRAENEPAQPAGMRVRVLEV